MAKAPKTTSTTKPKSPTRTVNIFDTLKRIDLRQEEYYDSMMETDQKQLHPLVMTRWMSGTSDPAVIQMLNLTNNKYNFILAQHKPLLMRMLLLSASGSSRRYQWLAKSKETSQNRSIKALREYYNCSLREAEGYVKMHTIDEIVEMAEFVGWQDDEVKALIKEAK